VADISITKIITSRHFSLGIKNKMETNFEIAMDTVLKHEGGYTEDHAGATKYGVTLRSLNIDIDGDGDIDSGDIRVMTLADVMRFYRREWWDKYNFDKIDNSLIATKFFDLAINMGIKQATLIAQRALHACSCPVKEDGLLGDQTFKAINRADESLIIAIRSEAAGFYRGLLIQKPEFEKFRNGWLNRAYS